MDEQGRACASSIALIGRRESAGLGKSAAIGCDDLGCDGSLRFSARIGACFWTASTRFLDRLSKRRDEVRMLCRSQIAKLPETVMHQCMDAKTYWRSFVLCAAGIAFGVANASLFCRDGVLLVSVSYAMGSLTRRATGWRSTACWHCSLQWFTACCCCHDRDRRSRGSFRAQFYGSLFAVATCAGLWLMFVFGGVRLPWFGMRKGGVELADQRHGFYASWVALFYSLKLTGFGYQTGWTQWLYWLRRQPLPRREFVERGIYRWTRHPVYLSFLGLIWFTPRMTADHAVLTGVWTVYIFVGQLSQRSTHDVLSGRHISRVREPSARISGDFLRPLGKWRPCGITRLAADVICSLRREIAWQQAA